MNFRINNFTLLSFQNMLEGQTSPKQIPDTMRRIGIFLFIVLIPFLSWSLWYSAGQVIDILHSEKVIAEITEYKKGKCGKNGPCFFATVQYTTQQGAIFSTRLNSAFYEIPPSIGNQILIYYRTDKPKIIHSKSLFEIYGISLASFIAFMIALYWTLYGIFFWQIFAWRIKRLQKVGIKIDVPITKIEKIKTSGNYSSSGLQDYYIIGYGLNPLTGKMQDFKSRLYFAHTKNMVVDAQISIYIDKKNPEKYLMDISQSLL